MSDIETIRVTVRMPAALWQALQAWIDAQPAPPTMTAVLLRALREFLSRHMTEDR